MSTYILLGGAGVFASHFAKYLLERKDTTKVIAVGRNILRGAHYSLDIGLKDERYRYEQIHILFEQDRLEKLFEKEKPDYVINYAALAYATSWEDSAKYYQTNLVSVARICEYLLDKKYLKRFLQIGTSELYGSVNEPSKENSPLIPSSPYAVSKMAADLHLETMFAVKNFPMNILRPSNAYGPGQQVWRVIPRAILCGLSNKRLPLEGGGVVKKSYLHVDDLSEATFLTLTKPQVGQIYNCGPDNPMAIREVIQIIAEELGMKFEDLCEEVPGRIGEDNQYWLDSSKIKKDFNWVPKVSIRKGIKDMVNWGKKYKKNLEDESTTFTLHS